MPCAVALDWLDLDDLGPHVGQHHAASRAHDHVGELDDAQAFEREFFVRIAHAITSVARKVLGKPACAIEPCRLSPASHCATWVRKAMS